MSDKPLPARPGRGPTLRSLGVRNFRLFFGGQLISQVGNWLTMVAQTLLVLRLTHNGVAVGLLQAAQFLPVLLIGPWTGLVVDRSDKRRLLLIIQSFAMLQSGVLAALAFSHRPPLFAFYLAATAGGFATAFDNPARRSFVVEMVPIDQVQNAVSLNTAMMTGARVVGPALAGLLIHLVGFGWCFATTRCRTLPCSPDWQRCARRSCARRCPLPGRKVRFEPACATPDRFPICSCLWR